LYRCSIATVEERFASRVIPPAIRTRLPPFLVVNEDRSEAAYGYEHYDGHLHGPAADRLLPAP